jgi:hypothetical protein
MAITPERGWSEKNEGFAREAGYETWDDWILEIEEKKGHPICGARTRPHRPCAEHMRVRNINGRCRRHGGRSLIGPVHSNWVDGRSSKYNVTGKLAEAYQQGVQFVENVMDLEEDIRLLDARMIQLVGELPHGRVDAAELLKRLRDHRGAIKTFVPEEHQAAMLRDIEDMEQVILGHTQTQVIWRDWQEAVTKKRELVTAEENRRSREHGPIYWPDVLFLMEKIKSIMIQHVARDAQAQILREFELLMPSRVIEAGPTG